MTPAKCVHPHRPRQTDNQLRMQLFEDAAAQTARRQRKYELQRQMRLNQEEAAQIVRRLEESNLHRQIVRHFDRASRNFPILFLEVENATR